MSEISDCSTVISAAEGYSRRHISAGSSRSSSVDGRGSYKPYTLNEYKQIPTADIYRVAGLGPNHIGTEEWQVRKTKIERMR
jgi:hypothetical protein